MNDRQVSRAASRARVATSVDHERVALPEIPRALSQWCCWGRTAATVATVLVLAFGAGCEVTNPGRVEDVYLNEKESHQALVNGAGRMLLEAMNFIAYTGALPAREIFPGGQTGAHGHSVNIQGGSLPDDQVEAHWENAQQARFIAEDAIRRFTEEGADADPAVLAQAYNWAGYANRLLGENMCDAVFDGGPIEENIRYFERAEEHFTNAIELTAEGSDVRLAAMAGRAQVRVWLQDWEGAAADARAISDDYVFWLNADDIEADTRNRVYWANANLPYRAYTIWNTFYEDYYTETGDPRAAWDTDAEFPYANASLSHYGQVPWSFALKYTGPSDDYPLASGREMRLIEAEALLAQGEWQAAMDVINGVRAGIVSDKTGAPLEPWTASSAEAAWTHLKRERGIELWLEARRLGDLRRWEENGIPGDVDLPNFEAVSPLFAQEPDARCFPIPESERDANPNIPSLPTG